MAGILLQPRRPACSPQTRVSPIHSLNVATYAQASDAAAGSNWNLIWIAVAIGVLVLILYTVVGLFFGWRKWWSSRRNIDMSLDAGVRHLLDEFLREFAARLKWSEESTDRLCSAGEEVLMSLAARGEDEAPSDTRRLRVAVRQEKGVAVMEFLARPQGTNLEEQIALVKKQDIPSSGRDLSLRLLEHYSASVRHRQYHATDLVTVRVDGSR